MYIMVDRWSIERLDTMDRSIVLCSMRVVECNMIAPFHLYEYFRSYSLSSVLSTLSMHQAPPKGAK